MPIQKRQKIRPMDRRLNLRPIQMPDVAEGMGGVQSDRESDKKPNPSRLAVLHFNGGFPFNRFGWRATPKMPFWTRPDFI